MEDILLTDPNPLPNLRKYWIVSDFEQFALHRRQRLTS